MKCTGAERRLILRALARDEDDAVAIDAYAMGVDVNGLKTKLEMHAAPDITDEHREAAAIMLANLEDSQ